MKILLATLRHVWKAPKFTLVIFFGMLCGTIDVIIFFVRQKIFRNYLPNFHTVDHGQLYRGGQPSDAGMKLLADQGIKTFIVLRTDCDVRKIVELTHGKMRVIHLPFNPYRPSIDILRQFLLTMKQQESRPVFIHCFHGADRTGMMCAVYRIAFQGWSKREAIKEMKRCGSHWWHYNLIDFLLLVDLDSLMQELEVGPYQKGSDSSL